MMRNPVFESSMTRRMRSFRAPMLLSLYVAFLLLVSVGALTVLQSGQVSLGNLRAGLETYVYVSAMQFMLIVLVGPALTAGSIAGERERQTLDLLLCTRVGSVRIVLGKLFSSVCFLGLMIVSSLPVMAVTFFFGGVSFTDMLLMLLFLIVTALACCSIGIFCSSLLKRTVTATVVAYLIVFALGIGTVVFPLLFQYGMLQDVLDVTSNTGSGSATLAAGASFLSILGKVPVLLLVNPGVGLMSLLVDQTGILQRTLSDMFGYRGGQLYSLLEHTGSVALINMGVLVACSAVLTALAALLLKPMGLKVKKK